MAKTPDQLFEESFFAGANPAGHTASAPAITPAAEFDRLASGQAALRFTTAKSKFRGLSVEATEKGYILRGAAIRREAFNLRQYLMADNQVQLKFSEELLNYEPEDELVKKSQVPLWVIRPVRDGAVMIERVWKS